MNPRGPLLVDPPPGRQGALWRSLILQQTTTPSTSSDLVAWRLCEACLDVEAASIMLFE
jgi:hypothetical protein